jgi:tRNA dimethylallyltransferase
MKKILVVCGPTGVGKTSLALRLAKEFDGEIISADSRQVYRGMDIGTGKDIIGGVWRTIRKGKEEEPQGYWEVEEIPIYLLDVIEPNEEFSVSHYYHLAWQEINGLWRKGKLPFLVGGTGFYIRAVVDGVETYDIPRNLKIRAKVDDWSKEKLFDYLVKLDPEKAASMNWSDKNNPYRLIRAIEVAIFRRENPFWQPPGHQSPDSLFIGLTAPFKFLYQRIDKRVEERIKQGVENEIKNLLDKGYSWENSALGVTIGYQEWQPFFEGRATRDEIIQRWKFAEHAYARRQMTWFKKALRQAQGHWVDISKKGWENKVEKLVNQWYTKTNAKEN